MGATDSAVPPEVEPEAPVVEAPAPEPAAPEPEAEAPGDAPWTADLATYFEDEGARSTADRFLREKIQPHVTHLEQQHSDYEPARALFDDLREDPVSTYLAVTEELYGEDVADRVAAMIADDDDPRGASDDEDEPAAPAAPELDPTVARMKAKFEGDEQAQAYDAELTRAREVHPSLKDELFAPFVIAAEGDFDVALVGYRQWEAQVQAQYGPAPVVPPPDPAAPAALGTSSDTPAAPVTQKNYASLDDALDDTLAEMRASREAPPVGTV